MKRAIVQLLVLVVASEVTVQLLVGDARLAQLLAPGGSWWAIVLVALALALRLLVILGVPAWLVYVVLTASLDRRRARGTPLC